MTQKIYNAARHLNIPLHFLLKSVVRLSKPCNILLIAKNFWFLKGINTYLAMSNSVSLVIELFLCYHKTMHTLTLLSEINSNTYTPATDYISC